jgi:hypothetical protein
MIYALGNLKKCLLQNIEHQTQLKSRYSNLCILDLCILKERIKAIINVEIKSVITKCKGRPNPEPL